MVRRQFASWFVALVAHPCPCLLLRASKTGSTTIIVDVSADTAGDQGEGLHVFPITFKNNNVLYEGYEVAVICDARDIHEDLIEMQFKEGQNVAKFSKPAMAAVFRLDKAQLDARILARPPPGAGLPGGADDTYIIDGRDAVRVNHTNNVARKGTMATKKTYEVMFPANVKLSQRAFGNPVGKDGEWTIAAQIQHIHRKPIGANIVAGAMPAVGVPGDAHYVAAVAGLEPDVFHVQLTWRFANASKDQELTVAAARGAATVAAAMAGL